MTSKESDHGLNTTDPHFYAKLILTPVICLLVFFAAVGNGLLCFVILRSKDSGHRPLSDMYIASLATADLLMCVIVFPFSVIYELERAWNFGNVFCELWLYLDSSLCAVTIYTMSVICMDVCFYVKQSFAVLHSITRNKIWILIACIWAAGLVLGSISMIVAYARADHMPYIGRENQCIFRETIYTAVVSSALIFLLPFVWCVYVYVGMIVRVLENKVINKPLSAAKGRAANNYNLPSIGLFTITDIQTGILTLGIKLLVFFVSWVPFFIVKVMHSVCEYKCTTPLLRSVVIWLPHVSSWVSPFIYGMLNKRIHHRLQHLGACLCNVKWKVQSPQSSMICTSTTFHSLTNENKLPSQQQVPSDIILNVLKADTNSQLMPMDNIVDPKAQAYPIMRCPITSVCKNTEPVAVTRVSSVNATYDSDYSADSASIHTYLPPAPAKQLLAAFGAKQRRSHTAVEQKQPIKPNILVPMSPQVVGIATLQAQNNRLCELASRDMMEPDRSPKNGSPLELEPENLETLQCPKLRNKSAISTQSRPALVQKLETSKNECSRNQKSKKRAPLAKQNSSFLEQRTKSSKERCFLILEATKGSDSNPEISLDLGQKPSSEKNGSLYGIREVKQKPDIPQQSSPAPGEERNRSEEGFLRSPQTTTKKSKKKCVQNPDVTKIPRINGSLEQKFTSSSRGSLKCFDMTKRLGMSKQRSPFFIQRPATKIPGIIQQIQFPHFKKPSQSKDVHLQNVKVSKLLDDELLQITDSPQKTSLTHQKANPQPPRELKPVTKKNDSTGSSKFTQETEVTPQCNTPQPPQELTPRKGVSFEYVENAKPSRDLKLMLQEKNHNPTYETTGRKNGPLQSFTRSSKAGATGGRLEGPRADSSTSLVNDLTKKAHSVCKTNTNKTDSKNTLPRKFNTIKAEEIPRSNSETPPYVLELTLEDLAALKRDKTFNMYHPESTVAMASSHSSVSEDSWSEFDNTLEPHTRTPAFSRNFHYRRPEHSKRRFTSCRKDTKKAKLPNTNLSFGGSGSQRQTSSKIAAYNSNPQKCGPLKCGSCQQRHIPSKIPTYNSNPPRDGPSVAGGSSHQRSRSPKTNVTTTGSSSQGPVHFNARGGSEPSSPSSDSDSTGMFVEVGSQSEGMDGTSSDDMKDVKPQQSFIGSGDADNESVYFTPDGMPVKNMMQLSGSEDDDYGTQNFWGIKTLPPLCTGQKIARVQKENRETERDAWDPKAHSSHSTVFDSHPKGLLAAILSDRHTRASGITRTRAARHSALSINICLPQQPSGK